VPAAICLTPEGQEIEAATFPRFLNFCRMTFWVLPIPIATDKWLGSMEVFGIRAIYCGVALLARVPVERTV
jgi:hypothetical protein